MVRPESTELQLQPICWGWYALRRVIASIRYCLQTMHTNTGIVRQQQAGRWPSGETVLKRRSVF
jgi:hypothetical protein